MCFKPLGCLAIPLAQGIAGASGNSVLNGTGVPSSSLGVNGDFYIDTNNSQIYGPKTAGSWGSPTSLIGAAGNGVLSGAGAPLVGLGENGDFYIDTTANAIYGPKTSGLWGSPTSLVGTNGTNGTTRLYELLTTQSSATISTPPALTWAILAGYNIPANTLVNNGDSLLIKAIYGQSNTAPLNPSTNVPFRRITFQGNSITNNGGLEPLSYSISAGLFRTEVEIIRTSSSDILIRNFHDLDVEEYRFNTYQNTLAGVNFATDNQLFFSVIQIAANTHTLRSLTIDKISS
jgi:hypothetical protein